MRLNTISNIYSFIHVERERERESALENKLLLTLISHQRSNLYAVVSTDHRINSAKNKLYLTPKNEIRRQTAVRCWCFRYSLPTRAMFCTWLLPPSGHFEIMHEELRRTENCLFIFKCILSFISGR